MSFSRRTLLKASAASAVVSGLSAPFLARAQTAEFSYKYANNLPDSHPMNARAREMAAAIKSETNGRFDLQIFPNNQLGSDTDMLSQIRSGGVEFFTLSGLILATLGTLLMLTTILARADVQVHDGSLFLPRSIDATAASPSERRAFGDIIKNAQRTEEEAEKEKK